MSQNDGPPGSMALQTAWPRFASAHRAASSEPFSGERKELAKEQCQIGYRPYLVTGDTGTYSIERSRGKAPLRYVRVSPCRLWLK